jgi:hypothetical protein
LTERAAPTERTPPAPQVVVMASGDLVPFEIRLERDGTDEGRTIAGHAEGRIELVTDDDPQRR